MIGTVAFFSFVAGFASALFCVITLAIAASGDER